MNDLIAFLRARLDEDEQWALAASKPYEYAIGNPPVPLGGVHWTWVVGDNWELVTPDPVTDEFVQIGDSWACNLATVEEWQAEHWKLPRTYAGTIEEMDASAARHIARHDPARVLQDVEAKRRIIAEHVVVGGYQDAAETDLGEGCSECGWNAEYSDRGGWCTTLRLLALPFASHADYIEDWRP